MQEKSCVWGPMALRTDHQSKRNQRVKEVVLGRLLFFSGGDSIHYSKRIVKHFVEGALVIDWDSFFSMFIVLPFPSGLLAHLYTDTLALLPISSWVLFDFGCWFTCSWFFGDGCFHFSILCGFSQLSGLLPTTLFATAMNETTRRTSGWTYTTLERI